MAGSTLDDEFVVDVVIEVESRGVDVDALARQVRLPGLEVHRTSGRGMVWLTAVVAAPDAEAAVAQVERSLAGQLDGGVRVATARSVASVGDLYARLDPDAPVDRLDLIELVEATLWGSEHPGLRVSRRAG